MNSDLDLTRNTDLDLRAAVDTCLHIVCEREREAETEIKNSRGFDGSMEIRIGGQYVGRKVHHHLKPRQFCHNNSACTLELVQYFNMILFTVSVFTTLSYCRRTERDTEITFCEFNGFVQIS